MTAIPRVSRLQRYCQRCQISSNLRTCAKLCASCVAAGWRWCSGGKHVALVAPGTEWRKRCQACMSEAARRGWHERRNHQPDPPVGYVTVAVVAARMCYAKVTIRRWLEHGWMRGASWRRPGYRTHWFVEDRLTYEEPTR